MSASKTSLQKKLAEIETRLSSKGGPRISEAEARRRRTLALAELAEMRVRTRKGELVEMKVVCEADARIHQTVRDSLLSMPSRLSVDFAAETDPKRLHERFTAEIRQALTHLSQSIFKMGQEANAGAGT